MQLMRQLRMVLRSPFKQINIRCPHIYIHHVHRVKINLKIIGTAVELDYLYGAPFSETQLLHSKVHLAKNVIHLWNCKKYYINISVYN